MTGPLAQERAGGDARLERLERYRPGLRLLALRSLGNEDAAEDAVQETLARAVIALTRGQPAEPANLPAFLAGIARHVVVDVLRAQRRVVSLDALPQSQHPEAEVDVLAGLVTAAERASVRAALSELSAEDRELVRLCYFEGLTPSEIAARLREPAERVRKRKSRALARLREAFHNTPGHAPAAGATREKERIPGDS